MKKGFTLIELFVIIGIIGILFLIGIPSFRAYQPSLELSSTTREIITDLRYAQQLAITEQVEHGIYFSSSTNKYQIKRYGTTEEILKEKSLPEKVSFSQIIGFTGDEVIFNAYGAVKGSESGTVTLITQNSTTTIDIRPSGFVKIIK